MTGSTRSSDGLDARRRRLLFRSWHRGTREADLIMGRFADVHIEAFSDAELDQYEHLLDAIETDLLAWVTGVADVPAEHDTAMFRRVRDFHLQAGAERWRKCRRQVSRRTARARPPADACRTSPTAPKAW